MMQEMVSHPPSIVNLYNDRTSVVVQRRRFDIFRYLFFPIENCLKLKIVGSDSS